MDIYTIILISCMTICVCMFYYECLQMRWKRRMEHVEKFKKKLDSEGMPIKRNRTPFIDV